MKTVRSWCMAPWHQTVRWHCNFAGWSLSDRMAVCSERPHFCQRRTIPRSFGSLRCETESRESTAEALRHHRLGQTGSSRLVACFSHADMRFAWLFAVAWSLGGADACVQREFGGSLALEHFFSCSGLMGSDRVSRLGLRFRGFAGSGARHEQEGFWLPRETADKLTASRVAFA